MTQIPLTSTQVLLKATDFSEIFIISHVGEKYVFAVRGIDMFQGLIAKITLEFFFWTVCCGDELANPHQNMKICVEFRSGLSGGWRA